MITTSEQIASLAGALALAQAEIENAAKDGNNPHFKSKYASMEAVVYACKATLPKHGLSYVQFPGMQGDYVTVTTRLMHKSGEWIEGTLPMPVGKRDAHGVGSAISYARRYSLMAVIGIAAEDDDGNGAVAGGEVKSAPPAKAAALPRPSPHTPKADLLDWDDILEDHPFGQLDSNASKPVFKVLQEQMRACRSVSDLQAWSHENAPAIWSMAQQARHFLRERFDELSETLPETTEAN